MNICKTYSIEYKDYVQIYAVVNNICNLDCYYCYNKAHNASHIGDKQLDLQSFRHFLSYIHQVKQQKIKVEIIGGEPTLHCDLPKLIEDFPSVLFYIYSNFSANIYYMKKMLAKRNVKFELSWHSSFSSKISFIDKLV